MNTKRNRQFDTTSLQSTQESPPVVRMKGERKKRSMEILQRIFAEMAWFG